MPAHEPAVNPYVGLRPFDRSDSFYFFGRRDQTAELLESLDKTQFLAVVGSSGCGKSSLIRAGLIPALLGGFLVEERARWRIGVMRPGDSPLRNLAAALCDESHQDGRSGDPTATLLEAISERHTEAVVEHVAPILGEGANQLLLIDQFEEIFSFRGSDESHTSDLGREQRRQRRQRRAEAADFVDLVINLAARSDLPLYTVLTMRTDFLGDCDLFYGLPEAMNRGRYLVPRLNRQQLREAIEGPALMSGSQLSPRLLDLLLNRLGDRSDRLPVLQHALLRTWDFWNQAGSEGAIDLEHYEAAGTLENALSSHAEEAMREDDAVATEHIFRRLTDTDVANRRIRRPSTLSDLAAVSGVEPRVVDAILDRFSEGGRHFVYRSPGATPGDPRVDISHESLIRRWQRLRDWVDEERESRDLYVEIVKGARRHELGRVGLLQDPELQINLDWRATQNPTKAWAERYQRQTNDFEAAMDYLDRSREAARAAEQRRRRRRNTLIASGIAVLAMILGFLSYINLEKRREMDRSLISEAKELLATDPIRAAEMLARVESPDAGGTLRMAGALNYGFTEEELDGHDGPVRTATFSPDGSRILSASEDGTARIWNLKEPEKQPIKLESGHHSSAPRTTVTFSPDGMQVVAASEDGTVELWSLVDALADKEATPLVLRGHTARVNSAVFSSDGELLVTASDDRTARVWPLTGAGAPKVLDGHQDSVLTASFSPDGRQVVTASKDGTAVVWEVASAAVNVPLTGHTGAVVAASFCCPKGTGSATPSNDGKLVVTASEDGTARVWDVEWQADVVPLKGHGGALTHAEFNPVGDRIVTASMDGMAMIWAVPNLTPETVGRETSEEPRAGGDAQPLQRWQHGRAVAHAAFSPDGTRVVTTVEDHTARLWRLDGLGEPVVLQDLDAAAEPRPDDVEQVVSVERRAPVEQHRASFSADGTKIVISGSDGRVRIWTAEGEPIPEPKTLAGQTIVHAEFSPEGTPERVVAAVRDGTVRLWGAEDGGDQELFLESPRVATPMTGAWFDASGELVITIAGQEARVWSAKAHSEPVILKGHEKLINSAAFNPRGGLIVTASDDGTARIWADTGESIAILNPYRDGARMPAGLSHAEFSLDGTKLVVSSREDHMARVWAAADGPVDSQDELKQAWRRPSSPPIELGPHDGAVTFASFSPRGYRVVTASRDKVARIWTLAGDSQPIELRGHRKPIYVARFSHDGTRVLTASRDLTARIWRADGYDVDPLELIGHEGPLTAASFSHDDNSVLTASEDGTARIWQTDGSDRRNPLVLLRYGGPVRAAGFSPKGDRVVTASLNGRVLVWGIERVGIPTEVLEKHRGGVFAASFDRTGSRVVTASADGTALLWAPDSEPYPLAGPAGKGQAVAFSPDGQWVAVAMLDGTARIWSSDGSELLATLGDAGTALTDLSFSPDGRRLVTATGDGNVRVWAIPDAASSSSPFVEPLLSLEGHRGGVGDVDFSPDGRQIVTASDDGTVRLWGATSGTEIHALDRGHRPLWRARFDALGGRVVVGSQDGGLWIWTPGESGEPLQLSDRSKPISSALFSPDGRRVVSIDSGGTLKIWDAESGKQLDQRQGQAPCLAFDAADSGRLLAIPRESIEQEDGDRGSRIVAAELSPDQEWAATVSNDGTVTLRLMENGAPGRPITVLAGARGDILAAAFKPDDSRVFTLSAYGLREWRLRGSERPELERVDYLGTPKGVRIASFGPSGTQLVLVDDGGEAWVWATAPSRGPIPLKANVPGRVRTAGFNRDGSLVVTGSEDGTARVWNALSGKHLANLKGHHFALRDVSLSPDGRNVVTASDDGTARIWDVTSGEQTAILSGHRFAIRAAEFSPDGTQVVTASDDGTARIWDPITEKMRHELKGHGGPVLAASFDPRGDKIVTASEDGTARVWLASSLCSINSSNPECRGEGDAIVLLGHRGPILTASFDTSGEKVLTSSQDGTVRVWHLSTEDLQDAIQEATRGRRVAEDRSTH